MLIPSYNSGALVLRTVEDALQQWAPVWLVVDGSTDGSGEALQRMAGQDPALSIIVNPRNKGKGAAVLRGLDFAARQGYTHALTMDSDGQHPAELIPEFMAASMRAPDCMILGKPVFDENAPALRVKGRQISNWWANLETLWAGVGDSLFGFRVYPIAPLRKVMQSRAFHAALRLRPRGCRAPVLDGRQAGQPAGARQVFHR